MVLPATRVLRTVVKSQGWVWFRSLMMMETQKIHHHYPHSDPSNHLRWTARECYEYMYDRPWEPVNDFYSDLVNGRSSFSALFGAKVQTEGNILGSSDEYAPDINLPEDQLGRWARVTYKIVLSYHGAYFDGWQKQPGLNTVQGLVERSVGTFVDDKKAQQLKAKGLPVDGMVVVAGRTDKGVTGLNQVCSFYTWRKDVKVEDIERAINATAPGKLRVVTVSKVSRTFHPNFCAKWRRYLYIFPMSNGVNEKQSCEGEKLGNICSTKIREWYKSEIAEDIIEKIEDAPNGNDCDGVEKPMSFSISKVDQLLRQLEGKLLSYKMFARDTKASRNTGPATECFVYHARAAEARLPCSDKENADVKVMCVELVANRFLRRMIRVLVATVVREAAAGSEDDVLLKLVEATCRRATAPPAPPDGLCFVDVGYSDFDPLTCFIR